MNFKLKIGDNILDTKRDITIIEREIRLRKRTIRGRESYSKDRWYKYKCNKCGYQDGWMVEYALINQSQGCSCCYGRTPVLGINTIFDTDKWMIKYIGIENSKKYTRTSNKKIIVKCPECGRRKEIYINNLYKRRSISCSCNDKVSFPNKFMANVLTQLNIEFQTEKIFNWCKYEFRNKLRQGRYDFYIPSKHILIEMDGGFHYDNNSFSGQTLEESILIDQEKDKLAYLNGLDVIRIDCDYTNNDRNVYIKEKILNNQKFNSLFDLSNINWNKCSEFASTNLIKMVCNIRSTNDNLTTRDISKITKLNYQTIIKYLKFGNSIGWCYYNPKEEMRKCAIRNFKNN